MAKAKSRSKLKRSASVDRRLLLATVGLLAATGLFLITQGRAATRHWGVDSSGIGVRGGTAVVDCINPTPPRNYCKYYDARPVSGGGNMNWWGPYASFQTGPWVACAIIKDLTKPPAASSRVYIDIYRDSPIQGVKLGNSTYTLTPEYREGFTPLCTSAVTTKTETDMEIRVKVVEGRIGIDSTQISDKPTLPDMQHY